MTTTLIKKANKVSSEFKAVYAAGQASELAVIAALSDAGYKIRKSSKEEDMKLDIDCWLSSLAISIKTSHATLKSGNLCFEMSQKLTSTGEWEQSWFYNGKANMYVVRVGSELYLINKTDLLGYISEFGWDRVTTNTANVNSRQTHYRYSDTQVGLVSLAKLLAEGIAQKLNIVVND